MDIRGKLRFFRQNMLIYIIGILLILGMKYLYAGADCEGLRWILGPTARWVEVLSGIPFAYEPGMGYANHGLRFLIAPSCSGVQFMIVTAAMLIFSFSHLAAGSRMGGRILRTALGLGWVASSLLLSYVITVFVNGLRILAAIYLPAVFERSGAFRGPMTPHRLHTMIGALVYFAALLTVHRLVGFLFARFHGTDKDRAPILGRCLSPLFWYFTIVLGIPFLNRASRRSNGQFAEFAFLVCLCCGSVLFLYSMALLICRKLRGRG